MSESVEIPEEKSTVEPEVVFIEKDDAKANVIENGGNVETSVIIPKSASYDSFTGLSKDELMKYANDPFWVRLRWALFIIFWVVWVAMLLAAILIIILAPKCPDRADLKWYDTDVIYNIYAKSFFDGDKKQDGYGDLEGMIQCYFIMTISHDLCLEKHCNKFTKKANKTLALLRRTLSPCSREVKSRAYQTLVRPQLECTAEIWNLCNIAIADRLELIQRAAARFDHHGYRPTTSVDNLNNVLFWDRLNTRRLVFQLTMFYKMHYRLVNIYIPPLISLATFIANMTIS